MHFIRTYALLLTVFGCVAVCQQVTEEYVEVELSRLQETYTLLDTFAESVWPGWDDYKRVEFRIQLPDLIQLLVNPAGPIPSGYVPLTSEAIHGTATYINRSRKLPITIKSPLRGIGGPISYSPPIIQIWLNEVKTDVKLSESEVRGNRTGADVSSLLALCSESQILMLVHELFHLHQYRVWKEMNEVQIGKAYRPDVEFAVYSEIEGEALAAAYRAKDRKEAVKRLQEYLVAFQLKRRFISDDIIRLESNRLRAEGIAQYANVKMAMLIQSKQYRPSISRQEDRFFFSYRHANAYIRESLFSLMDSAKGDTHELLRKCYAYGAFQAFLLDRLKPDWKRGFFEQNRTFEDVLLELCPVSEKEKKSIIAGFKTRYRLESLFEKHRARVNERESEIRSIESRKGKKYLIDLTPTREMFEPVPRGRTFRVGYDQMFPKGFETLTLGDIEMSTSVAPFRRVQGTIFEWVDSETPPGEKGYETRYESETGGVYENLVFTTRGFIIKAPRAEIHEDDTTVRVIITSKVR